MFSIDSTRQNLPGTIEKSVLANQIRPRKAFKVFKKVPYIRVNSRPGETYPYVTSPLSQYHPSTGQNDYNEIVRGQNDTPFRGKGHLKYNCSKNTLVL